ncbi:heavy-metal-associated domain-containing protein [Pseudonocardiaceae bacterium YIM PH 21723]|nr:heavy-metal-associated domain-containing protein [Pseudonocardiaceae bacterium YIM PH 21723]
MIETSYPVTGMTCGHCAGAVREELSKLDGVQDVAVDVATGQVTVSSAAELSVDQVSAAITEAGYQLAG